MLTLTIAKTLEDEEQHDENFSVYQYSLPEQAALLACGEGHR